MENQTREKYTRREHLGLGHGRRPRIEIDMEEVYHDITENKMSVKAVAEKYKVSEATLRRRHKEYQASLPPKEDEENNKSGYTLPPLPEKL